MIGNVPSFLERSPSSVGIRTKAQSVHLLTFYSGKLSAMPTKTLFSGRFPVRASIFRHSEICTVIYASNPTGCEKTASDISRVGVWPEIFQASWMGPGPWSESEQRVNVCTRSIQENNRRCPQKSESCRFTPKTFISGRIPVKANFFRHSDIFPVI